MTAQATSQTIFSTASVLRRGSFLNLVIYQLLSEFNLYPYSGLSGDGMGLGLGWGPMGLGWDGDLGGDGMWRGFGWGWG